MNLYGLRGQLFYKFWIPIRESLPYMNLNVPWICKVERAMEDVSLIQSNEPVLTLLSYMGF